MNQKTCVLNYDCYLGDILKLDSYHRTSLRSNNKRGRFRSSDIHVIMLGDSFDEVSTESSRSDSVKARLTFLAGNFDTRSAGRDVLTSLLNGVPSYKLVEKDDEARRVRRKEKKEREKEKARSKALAKAPAHTAAALLPADKIPVASTAGVAPSASGPAAPPTTTTTTASSSSSSSTAPPPRHSTPQTLSSTTTTTTAAAVPSAAKRPTPAPVPRIATSSFWQARPNIHISTMQRSQSITPPPMPSSPPLTPGPSISSNTSATSSKRPHTPDDDEEIGHGHGHGVGAGARERARGRGRTKDRGESVETRTATPGPSEDQRLSSEQPATAPRPRKKRAAVRKGWKGWVEGSPPPSEKLINLDVVTVLQERKTRSGKNFDAIGVGKEGWV